VPRPAQNGRRLDADLDEDELAFTVEMLNTLLTALQPAPVDGRSALALLIEVAPDGVQVPLGVLTARANIGQGPLFDHLKVLDYYQLVDIQAPEYGEEFELYYDV
jgi:hypothetical protein